MSPAVPKNTKPSLPKDWIVVTSKTHPNRVYYFNIRTNKSSWESPLSDKANEASHSKKRKNEQDNEDGLLRPTTPENDVSQTKPHERKKLRAKRKVAPAEPVDTPQMREVREKLHQKQEKTKKASKKPVPVVKKNNEISLKPDTTKLDSPKKPKKETVSVYNAEMLAVHEKICQRQSKSPASKKSASSKSSNNQSQSSKRFSLTGTSSTRSSTSGSTSSSTSTSTSSSTSTSTSTTKTDSTSVQNVSTPKKINTSFATVCFNKSKSGNTARNGSSTSGTSLSSTVLSKVKNKAEPNGPLLHTRDNTSIVHDSTDKSIITGTSTSTNITKTRKNIAKKRLDKLNDCLQVEQQKRKLAMNLATTEAKSDNISILDSPPSIYKNAMVRFNSLRSKVLRSSKMKQDLSGKKELVEQNDCYNKPVAGIDTLLKTCHEEESFYEEMEWSPIEDEKIMSEVQNVRVQLGSQAWDDMAINTPKNDLKFPVNGCPNNKDLYIIIDTNVFLSNIQAVEQARDAVFKSYGRPIIVVPWTVLRELDYIKDNKSESLQAKARRAVRFLYQHFSDKHPRVKGQTASDFERNKAQFAVDCPDDEILQTCLQVAQSGRTVVLLSYDINLCNKAMIHDILTLGRNDPLEKIDFLNAIESMNETRTLQYDLNDNGSEYCPDSVSNFDKETEMSDEILEEAKAILKKFLSIIVAKEMHNLYGDPWEKHTIIRPPWSPIDVLKCAVKHWMAAVSESFIRRAENILKALLENFRQVPDQGRKLRDVSHILERCSDFVQCAKQDKYPQLVQTTMKSFTELKKTCQQAIGKMNEEQLREDFGPEIDDEEQERLANIAFQYFYDIYSYARDICGLAAKLYHVPCDIAYENLDPMPSAERIREIQPELAANVNRLRTALSFALEEVNALHIKHRALVLLSEALINFMPESDNNYSDLSLLDLYYCLRRKESLLKIGLAQLHNLSIHFCRIASANSR